MKRVFPFIGIFVAFAVAICSCEGSGGSYNNADHGEEGDNDSVLDGDVAEDGDQLDSDISIDGDQADGDVHTDKDQVDDDEQSDEDLDTEVEITPGFVRIKAGTLWMGSPDGFCPWGFPGICIDEPGRDLDEELHKVDLTIDFEIQAREVTQREWRTAAQFMGWGRNPSWFGPDAEGPDCGNNCSVERINWYEALGYANYLSDQAGLTPCYVLSGCIGTIGEGCASDDQYCYNSDSTYTCSSVSLNTGYDKPQDCEGYRLPTDAEWEYAIRAGSYKAFYNGTITVSSGGNDPNMDQIGWYKYNSDTGSEKMTHPVGGKEASAWGLFDMHGNVWEWTWDKYCSDNTNYGDDPDGSSCRGSNHVKRGGGWNNSARNCRSADRSPEFSYNRNSHLGFRLARSLNYPLCEGVTCGPNAHCDGDTGECVCSPGYSESPCGTGICVSKPLIWVTIPSGAYEMGCSVNDDNCTSVEFPRHTINISSFEITETEITQEQYKAVMGINPSQSSDFCHICPVEHVKWNEAEAFCGIVGGRLPSEAEWEYAARGGTTTRYYCGDDRNCLDGIAWHYGNSVPEHYVDRTTHPVGSKTANQFGLYDMLGNVWEWVEDCWSLDYHSPENCLYRTIRGGSCLRHPQYMRVSNRCNYHQDWGRNDIGFRCARDIEITDGDIDLDYETEFEIEHETELDLEIEFEQETDSEPEVEYDREITDPFPTWTDPATGLVWKVSPEDDVMYWDFGVSGCEYYDRLFGGGWRLPNISELRTLVRNCAPIEIDGACGVYDECAPCHTGSEDVCLSTQCIRETGSCNPDSCTDDGGPTCCYRPVELEGWCTAHWSSSSVDDITAWYMDFQHGGIGYAWKILSKLGVRCVR